MKKGIKEFFCFVTRPAYVYYDKDAQGMREYHLSQEFIADSWQEAVDQAIAWAKNRFEAVIKDSYEKSFFSSIKVSVKQITRADKKTGFIETRSNGFFFEWKYDWPGTLEQTVASFKGNYSNVEENPNHALLKKMK